MMLRIGKEYKRVLAVGNIHGMGGRCEFREESICCGREK